MLVIARHRAVLEKLGLATLEQVKTFKGDLVKNQRGRRDIFRIQTRAEDGSELVLFLKRIWKPYKKDGLTSVLRRGRPWSISRQEWENAKALGNAGVKAAPLVAFGEDCGWLWEKFSYLVTEAAPATTSLDAFLRNCHDKNLRRRVFEALALEVRRLHDAGLASPDLFTRHVFVDTKADTPGFCLIDMARLDRRRTLPVRLRARDLAALNVTAPLRFVSAAERVRFVRTYAGRADRALIRAIARRTAHLLKRKKFRDFPLPAGSDAARK